MSSTVSPCHGLFVSATGTGVGKTLVSTALVHALVGRGLRVAGLKPIETGCIPTPADAILLATASGNSDLASDAVWYRAQPPLSPYAVELVNGHRAPDIAALSTRISQLSQQHDFTLVEGAGGLLVPLDREHTMADLAAQLGHPLLLIADDRLGVISNVLTTFEAAQRRSLPVVALVLNQAADLPTDDASRETNRVILRERMNIPVLTFPQVHDRADTQVLAAAAEHSGLVDLVLTPQR